MRCQGFRQRRKVNTFSDTSCGVYVSYRAFGVKAECLNFLPFYIVPSAKTKFVY